LELAEFFGTMPLAWLTLALSDHAFRTHSSNFLPEISIVTYLIFAGDWYLIASFDEYNEDRERFTTDRRLAELSRTTRAVDCILSHSRRHIGDHAAIPLTMVAVPLLALAVETVPDVEVEIRVSFTPASLQE
jgi:hypothetical protein